jgi:DNA-binding SARP family transcriptional activator
MESLWPEEDPLKLANRLSVALATVRAVLDPERRFDADHFVVGDRDAVRLQLAHLDVDLESFLVEAAEGLRLRKEEHGAEAMERLVAAETAYNGGFLEEDGYEDWAVPVREDAQAVYVQVTRALADDAVARAEYDAATRHLLRILECDNYDERAHLALITTLLAAGRHGEARRFFRAYCSRMDEIGVEAAAFPAGSAPAA